MAIAISYGDHLHPKHRIFCTHRVIVIFGIVILPVAHGIDHFDAILSLDSQGS